MNATAYISSGILERHLVGLTTPEEVKELEEMISQHPEIKEEMKAIKKALHAYALIHQVAPPEGLRQKILTGTKVGAMASAQNHQSNKSTATPSAPKTLKVEVPPPPVNWWIVATVGLALGIIAAGIYASNLSKEVEEGKAALADSQAEIAKLKTEKEAQIEQYETVKAELDLRSDHNLTPIRILGNFRAPEAEAILYWNGTTKKSYLDVRKLPDVPEGQQLQFWVTADGQTQNLGTPKVNRPGELPELKFSENPTIYFVTLEKAGDAPERPSRWRIVMTTGRI